MLERIELERDFFKEDHVKGLELFKDKMSISLKDLKKECEGDEMLEELFNDVLKMCLRYTKTVFDMNEELNNSENGVRTEEYREISSKRGKIHDTTIESINILARFLNKNGKDGKWVLDFRGDRAAYGRFAILLTFSRINT